MVERKNVVLLHSQLRQTVSEERIKGSIDTYLGIEFIETKETKGSGSLKNIHLWVEYKTE